MADATIDITAGTDDAGQVTAGTMYITSTSLNVNNGGDEYVLELFRDIPAPAGATITNAHLNVWPTATAYDSPNLTIGAQNSVAPAAPSATAYDISSRSRLAETVAWNAADIGIDAYKSSPDIAAVIQAFIDLAGYTENVSDIAIILTSAGSGSLRWASKDSALAPPQLYIAWTVGVTELTYAFPGDYWPDEYWSEYWPDYGSTPPPSTIIPLVMHHLKQQGVS